MKKRSSILLLALIFMISMTSMAMAQEAGSSVNRLDFTKAVLETLHIKVLEVTKGSFEDVQSPQDIPYVETAYQNKIISGYGTHFKPEETITKEQAITVLLKAMGEEMMVKKLSEEKIKTLLAAANQDSVSAWAKPYVAYALSKDFVDSSIDPKALLTKEDTEALLKKAQSYYETYLLREGLTAAEMLQTASEKFEEFDTYKYRGAMDLETKVSIPEQGEQSVKMTMTQEGVFQKPLKVYVKSTAEIKDMEIEGAQTDSEVYMDENQMYIRVPGEEKWMTMDFNPILQEIQKLTGQNQNLGNAVMSKEQMEMLGMFATYGPDVVKDGKYYYTIQSAFDSDSFKKIFQEVFDKLMDYFIALAEQNGETPSQAEQEMAKQQLMEIINQMDLQIDYIIYVDKETKVFGDMKVIQMMDMNMGEIKSHTHSTGSFEYYDFNGEVSFPEIKPEDVMDMQSLVQ
ncbi:MAG: S-layer homology domain-containing protein [Thermotaleaceae bacterium]